MQRSPFLNDSFSSSSDDDLSSNSDLEELSKASRHQALISTFETNNGLEESTNKQNIIFKLHNRERSGNFSNDLRKKVRQNAFNTVPNRLSFCLKEIVPYCYLTGHVFMGLTACGQFLLSYKVSSDDDSSVNSYNFTATYKYELYFWIYRPHNLLVKFYNICLFDDHGVDNLKSVTMTQWVTNPRTLIIHGASEYENEDSYYTIASVPKLGCLECKKMRNEYYSDSTNSSFRCAALCIKCNLTIHTKYSRSESDPKFDPKINLSSPDRIVIVTNGLIHMLNVELELNKPVKTCSNSINIAYIRRCDDKISYVDDILEHVSANTDLTTVINSDNNSDETIAASKGNCSGQKLTNQISNNGCEATVKENIVARIIADFAECETNEYPSHEKYTKIDQTKLVPNKYFEELIISCSGEVTEIEGGNCSAGGSSIVAVADSRSHNNQSDISLSNNKVRLLHRNNGRITSKAVNATKCLITTVELQSTSSSNRNLDKAAAKAYEFSEDTEKCEKISIFRKRRLADKKYEFSEDNSENIIPFTKLRSTTKTFALRTKAAKSASPNPHNQHLFSPSPTNFETPHTHRASPNHGFRSPCGSPVGNRLIMSPPGRALYGKSPTYTKFSSPRSQQPQLSKRSHYFDYHQQPFIGMDSLSNPSLASPHSDEFEVLKYSQPLAEVKPSNVLSSTITSYLINDKNDKEKPTCSKKLVRRFVEEDDATSVITSEEDDCISPGYHTTLPVEAHGSCYSDMQMISNASYQKLKCPVVVITQHTFDLEALTYYIANYLCSLNNKKYGFFYDWTCDPVNVCPLSSILTCIMVVNFTARELHPPSTKECVNCTNSQNLECVIHRKHFECRSLFTWNIESGNWQILDYGDLVEIMPPNKRNNSLSVGSSVSGDVNSVVKNLANDLSSELASRDIFNNLRILDSCTDKSKEILRDYRNSIEFYRNSDNSFINNFSCYSDQSDVE